MRSPRLSSVSGVSKALIATVGVDDAVSILVTQFGWDVAFQALARLDHADVNHALWVALGSLTVSEDS